LKEIEFIGEHLLPGHIGQFFIALNFSMSLLAFLAFFYAEKKNNLPLESQRWKNLGRLGFALHAWSVLSIVGILLYLMANQYYEYNYVFQHVSDTLPMKFILSAFWEGQEGSFLLWMFWHVVLGVLLMFSAGKWESSVMATLSAIQVLLASMLLGIVLEWGDSFLKIGVNPLLLTREVHNFPILGTANYLEVLQGSGLNPLLQNYWMTIHPPTLFFGFALVSIPFAYTVAALWRQEYKNYLREVLPWSLLASAILGTGIIMGAAWAYEALNFGGYWAWDPVENMSLVPWLVLIAALHTNLIAKSTGHSIRMTILGYIIAFVLILYSTFLTRSGVLGDSSVHAFTQMGLEWQLVLLIFVFLIPSLFLYLKRSPNIPKLKDEESIYSKEFWMYLGSLVLFFSAAIITFSTSIPVYNKIMDGFAMLFNTDFSAFHRTLPLDPIAHYNKNQIWVGILMGLLAGSSIYLRYLEKNWTSQRRNFLITMAVAALMAGLATWISAEELGVKAYQYSLLSFAAFFVILANGYYLLAKARSWRWVGSSLSHLGFGMLILGALASGLRQYHISTNPFAMAGLVGNLEEEDLEKYIFLLKNQKMFMSGYMVTYESDTLHRNFKEYSLRFQKIDSLGNTLESFNLHPVVVYDNDFTKVAAVNPSTKHYLHKDIFTTIASLPPEMMDIEKMKEKEDTLRYQSIEVAPLQKTSLKRAEVQLLSYSTTGFTHPEYQAVNGDIALGLRLQFTNEAREIDKVVEPGIVLRNGLLYTFPVEIHELGLKAKVSEKSLEKILVPDQNIYYDIYNLKEKEVLEWDLYKLTIDRVLTQVQHPNYQNQEGDVAIQLEITVYDQQNQFVEKLSPLFFIRNNQALHTRELGEKSNIALKLVYIDTETGAFQIQIGKTSTQGQGLWVDIAENFDRADYLVLEAIVFPWIGLVWLGCILITLGLTLSMYFRILDKQRLKNA
jgi:cytochrome c-type biogenesis protein CcmF